MLAHDRSDALTVRDELLECRSIALRVAALVAPVVEAAERFIDNEGDMAADRLDSALVAMKRALAKLGTP